MNEHSLFVVVVLIFLLTLLTTVVFQHQRSHHSVISVGQLMMIQDYDFTNVGNICSYVQKLCDNNFCKRKYIFITFRRHYPV